MLFCFSDFVSADFMDSLEKTAIKKGLDLATNPNDFFLSINNTIENLGTDPFNKRFQLNFSMFWNFLTVGNFQIKYKAYKGSKIMPEIIGGLSYWNIWSLSLISSSDFSASASGFTPFITLGKELKKDLKFFAGAKYSIGNIKVKIQNANEEDSGDMSDSLSFDLSSLASISSTYKEFGIYTGINYLRFSGKEVVALIGYYPGIKKIFTKAQVSSSVFDWGFCIYPDSVLGIDLFWNMHLNL